MSNEIFAKAMDRAIAITNKCKDCIPRTGGRFECHYDQMNAHYYNSPCSLEDWAKCPWNNKAETKRMGYQ